MDIGFGKNSINAPNLLSKEQIGKGVRYLGGARVLTAIAGTFSTILIIRILTKQDFAYYAFVLTLQAYIEEISSLGLPHIIQRYIPELRALNSSIKIKKCITFCALIGFAASLLVSAGAMFLLRYFPPSGLEEFRFGILLSGCALGMISYIFWIFRLSLVALLHFREMSVIWAITSILRLCAISVAFLSGGRLASLIAIEIIIICFTSLVVLWVTQKNLSRVSSNDSLSEWPANFLRRSKKYAIVSYSYDLAGLVLSTWTDLLVVATFLRPSALASLAFSSRVSRLLMKLTPGKVLENLINSVFLNKYVINPSADNLQALYHIVFKVQFYFIAHLVVTFWLLSDVFIYFLFGQKYLTEATLVLCVLLSEVANGLLYPSGLVVRAIEKPTILLQSKVFAIYNILAYAILIKPLGVYGVVLATGSANWLGVVYVLLRISKSAGLRLPWKSIGYTGACVLLWGTSLWLFRMIISSSGLSATQLVLPILALLGAWGYASFHAFDKQERSFISNMVGIKKAS